MKAREPQVRLGPRIARVLASTAASACLVAGAWYAYDAATSVPVRRVVFSGELERLPQAELEAFTKAVESAPPGISLREVRSAARRISWVRDAAVRRHFPDVIEVAFEAHVPLARWNDAGFVSERGETFTVDHDAKLPRFRGSPAAAVEMARAYPSIARSLEPLRDPLAELRHSPRGGWQVQLESGLVIELGRGDVEARISRFVAAAPHLAGQGFAMRHADLRYPNGFAVRRVPRPAAEKARTP